jgi:hypothetical protein
MKKFCIFFRKYLVISKKSSNFARFFRAYALKEVSILVLIAVLGSANQRLIDVCRRGLKTNTNGI